MAHCSNCSRRDFVRMSLGAGLAAGFGFPAALGQSASGAKAKACILLWMQGAQSQLDTWDLKPGTDTGGPFKAIKTTAPGVEICEHLPRIAGMMDKLAVIRSMVGAEDNHYDYQCMTGRLKRGEPPVRGSRLARIMLWNESARVRR